MSRSAPAWQALVGDLPLPAAVLDLDALDANTETLLAAMRPGPSLRVATKSIRVPDVLRHLLDHPSGRLRGLMTWSAHETRWLAERGFDDMLLAYPIGRADEAIALASAASRALVRAVVDHPRQAELLSAAAQGAGVQIGLCLDVDVSLRPGWLGGRVHLGVRRSPIRGVAEAVALARAVRELPGVTLDSVMAYEAQVAGMRDHHPGGEMLDPVRQLIKQRSIPLAARRRAEVVAGLRAEGLTIEVVNGGGTGSVGSTSRDRSVTEVTAGSGFVCPHLFDGYDGLDLQPALVFALAVVRHSDPDHVTAAGGGYIASGSAGADRLPVVLSPEGLEPVALEGFGEVQTPFRVLKGPQPPLGSAVICRHAKAGELAERFARYHLVRDGVVTQTAATVRGEGGCFF